MKKTLAFILAAIMIIGLLPASDLGLVNTVEAAGGTYVKVTSEPADWSGQYLIVYEDESMMFNGALATLDAVNNYQTVKITNNSITATAEDYFTIAAVTDGYSIQSASGYFIGNTSDANALKSSTTTAYANTLSMNADGTVNIVSKGSYLRFNTSTGQDRFRYYKSGTYSSQKAICLYKLDSSGTVTETTAPATATPEVTSTPVTNTATPVASTPTPAAGDSKTFTLITSSADMTAGDYLIVNTGSAYALNSTVTSSCMGRTAVTINGTQITTTDAAIIWNFQKNADGNWTIYNAALGQYLVIDGTDSTSFKLSASADYAYVATDEGTDCIQLASTDAGGRFIYYNGASDTNGFRTYAVSNTSNIQLYRSGSTSSTTPAPSTATPTPDTVTPTPVTTTPTPSPAGDLSGRYYFAGKRSGDTNYQYILGVMDGSRYDIEDSGVTELPSVITAPESDKVFVIEKNTDGTYRIYAEGISGTDKYLGHTSGNSGQFVAESSALSVTIDALDSGAYNIHYAASDEERYLSINATATSTYAAWYRTGQTKDLYLIPVSGEVHVHTPVIDPAVEATCEGTGLTEGSHCSECGAVLSEQQIVSALGHDYAYTSNGDGTHTAVCQNDTAHTYSENCNANGENGSCALCGYLPAPEPGDVTLLLDGKIMATYDNVESVELPVLDDLCAFEFVGWMVYDANFETTTTAPVVYNGSYTCNGDATLVAVYRTTAVIDDSMLVNLEFSALNTGKVDTAAADAADIVLLKEVTLTGDDGSVYTVWQQATAAPATDITAEDASIGDKYIVAAFYNGVYYALDNTSDKNAEYIPGYPITDLAEINDEDHANYIYTVQYGENATGGSFSGLVFQALSSTNRYLHLNTNDINTDATTLHAFLQFEEGATAGTFKIKAPIQSNESFSYIAFGQRNTVVYAYVTEDIGHNYTVGTTEATCTEAGRADYYCAYCGDQYTEEVEALGHNWVIQSSDATCTEVGTTVKTCQRCGQVETTTDEALGHIMGQPIHTDGTAEAGSTHTTTCARCGESETSACSFEIKTSTATCEKDGFIKYTCTECGYTYTVTVTATGQHSFEETERQPGTCVSEEVIHLECTVCGTKDVVYGDLDPDGHAWCESAATEPTYFLPGATEGNHCELCGEVRIESEIIPAAAPFTLGAAARVDKTKIRFGGMLDVETLQQTYDAGETLSYGFLVRYIKDGNESTEVFAEVSQCVWTEEMDNAADGGELAQLLRAAGCKVYGYTEDTITYSLIMTYRADPEAFPSMEFIFKAQVRLSDPELAETKWDISVGRALKNSINNIVDNNGVSVEVEQ